MDFGDPIGKLQIRGKARRTEKRGSGGKRAKNPDQQMSGMKKTTPSRRKEETK